MNSSSLAEETKTSASKIEKRVRIACVLALLALGLIVFSLLVPKPLPVIVAMSVAQAIGTLSLVMFLHVVSRDVWRFMGGGKTAPLKEELPSDKPPAA
jgi:protein-S-isoprenylcysteine O-methyltransferase Ste14